MDLMRRLLIIILSIFIAQNLFAQTIYRVSTTGSDANDGSTWAQATTIEHALSLATAGGDEIWIEQGTYNITKTLNITEDNISLYGGFSGDETAISQRDWMNNLTMLDGGSALRIMRIAAENIIVDGIWFQNGYGKSVYGSAISAYSNKGSISYKLENCTFKNNNVNIHGGAINNSAYQNGRVESKIINCEFYDNTAEDFGGAIYNYTQDAESLIDFVLSDNHFENNTADSGGALNNYAYDGEINCYIENTELLGNSAIDEGAAIKNVSSRSGGGSVNFEMLDCDIIKNTANKRSGGIVSYGVKKGAIKGCNFLNNQGGDDNELGIAIQLSNCKDFSIVQCSFIGNISRTTKDKAALLVNGSNVKIINSIFSNNETAILIKDSNAGESLSEVTNSTFYSNKTAVKIDPGMATITKIYNAIFYQNTKESWVGAKPDISGYQSSDIAELNASNLLIENCLLQEESYDFVTGPNLIDQNPQFIDAVNGDFSLNSNSPAIDYGENYFFAFVAGVPAVSTLDYAGNPRLFNTNIDAGAYEYQNKIIKPICTTITLPSDGATNIPIGTNIIWDAVANATSYKLEIGTSSGSNDVISQDVGNVTSFDLPTDLAFSTTYYASVIPRNSAGDATGCTEINFSTEPDSDGDGVPDSKDKCPNTPKGEPVDVEGCTLCYGTVKVNGTGSYCETTPINLTATLTGNAVFEGWTSSGDGSFGNATALTTVYTPGPSDLTSPSVTISGEISGPIGCKGDVVPITIPRHVKQTPEFPLASNYCMGDIVTLPSRSDNDIRGTWSPATVNTATAGRTTYTFTPDNSCDKSIDLVIDIFPIEKLEFSFPEFLCVGEKYTLPNTSDNGITGHWNEAEVDSSIADVKDYIFIPDSVCVVSNTFSFEIRKPVDPIFSLPESICIGQVVNLPSKSINGIQGTWNPSRIDPTVLSEKVYVFTPEPSQKCVNDFTINIEVTEKRTASFDLPESLCVGTSFTLPRQSLEGYVGRWNMPIDTSTPGEYTYEFTPHDFCVLKKTIHIKIEDKQKPVFDLPNAVCSGDNMKLPSLSLNGIKGTWSPLYYNGNKIGNHKYIFTPDAASCGTSLEIEIPTQPCDCKNYVNREVNIFIGDTYTFSDGTTVGDKTGSYKHTETIVHAQDCDEVLSIEVRVIGPDFPNAFSPNRSRGINDGFGIINNTGLDITNYNLKIYNRWGNLVFESNDANQRWLPESNNSILGAYTWVAEYEFNEKVYKRQGIVHLIH